MSRDVLQLDWTQGNAVRLLKNGQAFFPALCQAIDAARSSVHLETYIFTLDRSARAVLVALARASARGVKVRVVIDGFGSQDEAPEVMRRIVRAGGQCRIYRPEPRWLGRLFFSRNRLRRLHRKMAVIDGRVAFVGGINIVDDYDDLDVHEGHALGTRFDFAVEVVGPLVPYAVHAQELLWVRLRGAGRRRLARLAQAARDSAAGRLPRAFDQSGATQDVLRRFGWRGLRRPPYEVPGDPPGVLRAALVLRDNLRFRQTFERAYLYGIARARKDILIASAYFFPGLRFRRALARAAARGVRVRLLLQGKIEYRMQYYATNALYAELLGAGIEIYEYMPSYLHAKVAVIDDVASVGSSNLDPFSLLLAREANVIVDDAGFASQLRAELEAEMEQGGHQVLAAVHGGRGRLRRWIDNAAYTLLRIGVALTGQSARY